jgi:hypothetical protein
VSHHRFDQTLEEALERCLLGSPDRVPEGAYEADEEDPRDYGCAVCRGEICVACGGDAYDCQHDLDQQHGWAS